MSQDRICLASDNFAPVHPLVMKAIVDANEGPAPAYGDDSWTARASALIQQVVKRECKVLIVPNGTGANVLGLKLATRKFDSIICTDIAHIQCQEAGATESLVGAKLLTIPHREGKATVDDVRRKVKSERASGKHSTSPRVLSITQSTEIGTIYSLRELELLSSLCKEEELLLHVDGSRIYNAAAALGCSLAEIVQAARVDLLSLGGAKGGLMCAEALLIMNPALLEGSAHLHKQTLQLVSKMRYLSAQYIPFFTNGLWQTLAVQANERAQELATIIERFPELSLSCPVETNQIFFTAPLSWIAGIQERVSCYIWDEERCEIRLVTSWNTSAADVAAFQTVLAG